MATTQPRPTVRALLVGIGDYSAAGWQSLHGPLNDIAAVRSRLLDRCETAPLIRELRDGDATVRAVTDAVADHLGQAGPEDTVLFWFSGHGTEFLATEPEHLLKEATGRNQALVCADGPLLDKELGRLLDTVAAGCGQVTAVLDCCYSGGGTRATGLRARYLPPDPAWGAPGPAITARDTAGRPPEPGHLLLAACRLNQLAYESELNGTVHGLFSHAVLRALSAAGPGATGREILAAAHCAVQSTTDLQHPVLYPTRAGGVADRPFLGGAPTRAPSPHLLRFTDPDWEVDCGAAHGLRESRPSPRSAYQGTEFTVTGDGRDATAEPRAVKVREVHPHRALVDPEGWRPDPARVYPVALSALALPPASVAVGRAGGGDAAQAERWLRAAVDSAGPDGGPTPLLRVGPADPPGWRVEVDGGRARLLRRDGTPAVPDPLPLTGPGDAGRVVGCLLHLTRWHRLLGLENLASPLASLVKLEVVHDDGRPARRDDSGELLFSYEGGPGDWHGPQVSVRVHNRSASRTLWCAVLDLTDSLASSAALYPGHFIGPGRTGHSLDGRPAQLTLPPGRPVRPGAQVRDWLKLIVAEGELNTLPFELDAWNPRQHTSRLSGPGQDGILRFTAPEPGGGTGPGGRRDLVPGRAAGPGQWAALTVPLRTTVPEV